MQQVRVQWIDHKVSHAKAYTSDPVIRFYLYQTFHILKNTISIPFHLSKSWQNYSHWPLTTKSTLVDVIKNCLNGV